MRGTRGRLLSLAFVLLWSTGFIVARTVRPYADPFAFVSARFAVSMLILVLVSVAARAPWPRTARGWIDNLITGALMQGVYVGITFWAVKHGLPPSIAALFSGLQPLLTALLALPLLGERVSRKRWAGIILAFAGALIVLAPALSNATAGISLGVAGAGLVAMLGITLGTIWQKRTGGVVDLRSGAAIQLAGGLMVTVPFSLATEHGIVPMTFPVLVALAWAVLVLNTGASLLLLSLIKRGAVAAVTSLFYLTPPVTALMAYAIFGESLAAIQFAGMALAVLGVSLANRG